MEKELSEKFPLIDDRDFDYHAKIIKEFISTQIEKAWRRGFDEANLGVPNPCFSQAEVDRLITKVKQEAIAREKLLKDIHREELDCISCMDIEQFVSWRYERKNN